MITKNSSGNVIEIVEYAYDAFDRRIEKSVDADGDGLGTAEVERFLYDGDHIALVFDGEGNQTHRYLHGPQIDQVLAEETADGQVQWALTDNQGTVRDVIDITGAVLNHISYDSFGQMTAETNPEVDFRFGYTGREFDEESGLYYYRARYYDPAVGQFISEDPIEFAGGDDNLYGYVGNSPANYVDPTGLIPPPVAGALIGGGLDLGVQLLTSEGDFGERLSNVDWVSVGGSALSGAAGVGLTNKLIGKGASLTTRVLGSGTISAGIDGLVIGPASDAIKGNPITACSILQDAAIGFVGGAGGELLGELISPSVADNLLENVDEAAEGLTKGLDDTLQDPNRGVDARVRANVEASRNARQGSSFGEFSQDAGRIPGSPGTIGLPDNFPGNIHPGQQGKHIPGHNNFIPGRSPLNPGVDPQKLLNGVHTGEHKIIRTTPRNLPVVDFGQPIGEFNGQATQFGIVHFGKKGAHIIPANPVQY